jgi:hypothetical protein
MFIEQEQAFCGHAGTDRFSLGYYGSNPIDTTMYFYIICKKGDTIFRDEWPGKWFLTEENSLADSAKIAEIHRKMHLLIEGKLPVSDSVIPTPTGGPIVFSYNVQGHFGRNIYYSAAEHRVGSVWYENGKTGND